MSSTCVNCGSSLDSGDKFCGVCGTGVMKRKTRSPAAQKAEQGASPESGLFAKTGVLFALAFSTVFWVGFIWHPHIVTQLGGFLLGGYSYLDRELFLTGAFTVFAKFILFAIASNLLMDRHAELSKIAKLTFISALAFAFGFVSLPAFLGVYWYDEFIPATNFFISLVVAVCSALFYFIFSVVANRFRRV